MIKVKSSVLILGRSTEGAATRRWFFSTSSGVSFFLAVSLVACATSRSTETLGVGLTVNTFVREYTNAHLVVQGSRYFLVDAGLAFLYV